MGGQKREDDFPGSPGSASNDMWRYLANTALGVPFKAFHGSFIRVRPSSSYIYEHLSLPLFELDVPRSSMISKGRGITEKRRLKEDRREGREARQSARGRYGEGVELPRKKRQREREPQEAGSRKMSVSGKLAAARNAVGGVGDTSPRKRLSPKLIGQARPISKRGLRLSDPFAIEKPLDEEQTSPKQIDSGDVGEDATSSALARARARALESANLVKVKGKGGSKVKGKGSGGKGNVERRMKAGRVTVVTSPVASASRPATANPVGGITEQYPDSEADLRAQALRSMLLKGVAVRRKPLTKT